MRQRSTHIAAEADSHLKARSKFQTPALNARYNTKVLQPRGVQVMGERVYVPGKLVPALGAHPDRGHFGGLFPD